MPLPDERTRGCTPKQLKELQKKHYYIFTVLKLRPTPWLLKPGVTDYCLTLVHHHKMSFKQYPSDLGNKEKVFTVRIALPKQNDQIVS